MHGNIHMLGSKAFGPWYQPIPVPVSYTHLSLIRYKENLIFLNNSLKAYKPSCLFGYLIAAHTLSASVMYGKAVDKSSLTHTVFGNTEHMGSLSIYLHSYNLIALRKPYSDNSRRYSSCTPVSYTHLDVYKRQA